jgi:hypothetical protein
MENVLQEIFEQFLSSSRSFARIFLLLQGFSSNSSALNDLFTIKMNALP